LTPKQIYTRLQSSYTKDATGTTQTTKRSEATTGLQNNKHPPNRGPYSQEIFLNFPFPQRPGFDFPADALQNLLSFWTTSPYLISFLAHQIFSGT